MTRFTSVSRIVVILGILTAIGSAFGDPLVAGEPDPREPIIARAQVWTRTNPAVMDIRVGPRNQGAFPFRAIIRCDYDAKELGGRSPKFACRVGDDELKIKYGGTNGEVYGEVLATRLLWALGFGADRMYPVNVICRGCPEELGGIERSGRGQPLRSRHRRAQDAGQGTGSRRQAGLVMGRPRPYHSGARRRAARQSRCTCGCWPCSFSTPTASLSSSGSSARVRLERRTGRTDKGGKGAKDATADCNRPFLMVSDLGLTFGRASATNANSASSVNLAAWRETPVWMEGTQCTGQPARSR